jgi:hypothetical protein
MADRTMRRWRERLEADGYSGLVDRRRAKPSDKRVPLAQVEQVLRLYREDYFDLNIVRPSPDGRRSAQHPTRSQAAVLITNTDAAEEIPQGGSRGSGIHPAVNAKAEGSFAVRGNRNQPPL